MTKIGYVGRYNNDKHTSPPKSRWIKNEMDEWRRLGYDVVASGFYDKDITPQRMRDVDFIIVHHADSVKYMCRLGKPFIVISHADDVWKDNGAELKKFTQTNLCKGIGYISSYHKRKYLEWGITAPFKRQLIDTPVNIDFKRFNRTKPLGDKVVTGGRFFEHKGYHLAMKAVPDIYIYGKSGRQEYIDRLKNMGTDAKFLGYVTDDKLADLLNDSWLYMCTIVDGWKHKDYPNFADGIPTTIKEALAMELQVITSPVRGTIDFDGYVKFVDPMNTEEVKKAIKNLPKERNVEGRKFVEKNYHIDRFIENVEPVIKRYTED